MKKVYILTINHVNPNKTRNSTICGVLSSFREGVACLHDEADMYAEKYNCYVQCELGTVLSLRDNDNNNVVAYLRLDMEPVLD